MAEVIKMPGTVRSVNGIEPDANANVDIGENLRYVTFVTKVLMSPNSTTYEDDYGLSWTRSYSNSSYGYIPHIPGFCKSVDLSRSYVQYLGYNKSGGTYVAEAAGNTNLSAGGSHFGCAFGKVVSYTNNGGGEDDTYYNTYSQIVVDLPMEAPTTGYAHYCLVTLAYVPLDASTSA